MPVHEPQKLSKVVIHPLVLLSVVDHFNRMGKVGNVKRVVGVLLGSHRQGVLDVSNSFAGDCLWFSFSILRYVHCSTIYY